MSNSTKRRVEVDGQVIQYVNDYIYLGQLVSFENRQDIGIGLRIDNAWKSYWSMKTYMKGGLPLSFKRKLVEMCILPVLTYDSEIWSLTKLQKSKLKICQRAMERSILGLKGVDRVRNTVLRSRTGITDVGITSGRGDAGGMTSSPLIADGGRQQEIGSSGNVWGRPLPSSGTIQPSNEVE